MDKISVIIPVYNVEKYIHQCLDSVINQTYKNLEIILIDDGSTDKSGGVCDEYANRDKRIKVIHKQNEGVSQARNTGLDICTGDYIAFIDPDDFIQEHTYEILMNYIKQNKADIVWFDYFFYSLSENNSKIVKRNMFNKKIFYNLNTNTNRETFAKDLFQKYHLAGHCWNKLYKKKIWNDIRFPYKMRCEDGYVLMPVLMQAKNILVVPDNLYYYRTNNYTSLSKNRPKNFKHDFIESRWIQAIEYNVLYPNSKEANTLLYRAYREAFKYILSTQDKNYKFCGEFVSKQAISLLKKNLPFKKRFSMLLSVIIYNLVAPFCLRK